MITPKSLLITDLDNTLWDWFAAWHASFSAMLTRLEELSGVPASVLEPQIKRVHQQRGTSEYSHLLNEVPSLVEAAHGVEPLKAYDDAIHALNSARKASTNLYPGVREALEALRSRGVQIVAYTESIAFWTEWRIKHTGLDGIIDILYSAADHDLPNGVSFDDFRYGDPEDYGLKVTRHHHVPLGVVKPNRDILLSILNDCRKTPEEAVYVGDSLMKDIAMAQQTGVLDVHAKYGEPQHLAEYALLQRVSHWPDRDVAREQELTVTQEVTPTHVLDHDLGQLLGVLDSAEGWRVTLNDQEKVAHYIEVWKQTITVQQHFNDIEWRIRGLALTAATFAIGAAAVAANDGQSGVSVIILIIGVVLWYAFYFVDRFWYHPLLIGSVKHGEKVEAVLSQVLPAASLTRSISDASPVDRPFPIKLLSFGTVQQPDGSGGTQSVSRRSTKLHSSAKLGWFYTIGGVALLGSAVGLGIYSVSVEPSKPDPVIVQFDPSTLPTPSDPTSAPTTKPKPSKIPSPTATP